MAFADWSYAKSGTSVAQWDSLVPIVGTHSWVSTGDSDNYAAAYTSGVNAPCGRIRVFHKEYDPAQPGGDPSAITSTWGIFSQIQSSFALSSVAYTLVLFPNLFNQVVLMKGDTLTSAITDTTGLASANYGSSIKQIRQEVYAMQLHWQTDPITGNILLIGSVDGPIASPSTYDWSTLTAVVNYTDGASPYSTGVTAGWFGHNSVSTYKNYYDEPYIYTD